MPVPSGFNARWRGLPANEVAFREWDGEVVVYNRSTGSTHLLDGFSAMVLRQLTESPAPWAEADWAAALAANLGADDKQRCDAMLATVLREFDRLGLAHAEAP